jgi:serine/threonine protein kinase
MTLADVGDVLLARYRLQERLGDGGSAAVFRAVDERLGRDVAVKVYAAEGELSDSERRDREARALAALRHPAIVPLFDAHLESDPAFLVLEYVRGETLADRLTRGALSASESRELGMAAADGLAVAHTAGIMHRDVKPANLMLPSGSAPFARLLDFGIAHSLGTARATARGTVVGSAVYLSPEQARGETVTAASDVYSLGLVLIECLTGRPAFSGSTGEVMLARLVRSPALDAEELAADAALLARMTAIEPADRPSAEEVREELRRPARTRLLPTVSAEQPTQPMTAPATIPAAPGVSHVAHRPAVAGAVAGGLALVVGAGVLTGVLTAAGLPGPASSPPSTPVVTTPAPAEPEPQPVGPGGGPGKDDKPGHGPDKDKKP